MIAARPPHLRREHPGQAGLRRDAGRADVRFVLFRARLAPAGSRGARFPTGTMWGVPVITGSSRYVAAWVQLFRSEAPADRHAAGPSAVPGPLTRRAGRGRPARRRTPRPGRPRPRPGRSPLTPAASHRGGPGPAAALPGRCGPGVGPPCSLRKSRTLATSSRSSS